MKTSDHPECLKPQRNLLRKEHEVELSSHIRTWATLDDLSKVIFSRLVAVILGASALGHGERRRLGRPDVGTKQPQGATGRLEGEGWQQKEGCHPVADGQEQVEEGGSFWPLNRRWLRPHPHHGKPDTPGAVESHFDPSGLQVGQSQKCSNLDWSKPELGGGGSFKEIWNVKNLTPPP